MRRTHLKGHTKILKRLLVHSAASNMALLMRTLFGIGKPRRLQEAGMAAWKALRAFIRAVESLWCVVFMISRVRTRPLGLALIAPA